MATLKTNKKYARIRDRHQCQICGDILPVSFGRLEVHHITFRCHGGTDDAENLITLCDLCHAVLHDHMDPAWVGLPKFPPEERKEAEQVLREARDEFDDYLKLPKQTRNSIQQKFWSGFGIQNLKLTN